MLLSHLWSHLFIRSLLCNTHSSFNGFNIMVLTAWLVIGKLENELLSNKGFLVYSNPSNSV